MGKVANFYSDKVLDQKDHFSVTTPIQAQSSLSRVLKLQECPDWFNGSLAELQNHVLSGASTLHPKLNFNVSVPIDKLLMTTASTITNDQVKVFASSIKKELEERLLRAQEALVLLERLESTGLSAEEFSALNKYIKQEIVYTLSDCSS